MPLLRLFLLLHTDHFATIVCRESLVNDYISFSLKFQNNPLCGWCEKTSEAGDVHLGKWASWPSVERRALLRTSQVCSKIKGKVHPAPLSYCKTLTDCLTTIYTSYKLSGRRPPPQLGVNAEPLSLFFLRTTATALSV